jgi:hypothetical protein
MFDPSILKSFNFRSPTTLGTVMICEFSMLKTDNSRKKSMASVGKLFNNGSLM